VGQTIAIQPKVELKLVTLVLRAPQHFKYNADSKLREGREMSQPIVKARPLSTVVPLEGRWLSPSLIDLFAENQQDWVSQLQHDWDMEIYAFSLPGIQCDEKHLKKACLTIQEFVALTFHSECQAIEISQQSYWYYTCCLQVVGLGRVRVVVVFDDPQKSGQYAVLLGNRLDWSPRFLLSQWLEHYSVSTLYGATKAALIQQSRLLSAIL
jgi:hypothetical protein